MSNPCFELSSHIDFKNLSNTSNNFIIKKAFMSGAIESSVIKNMFLIQYNKTMLYNDTYKTNGLFRSVITDGEKVYVFSPPKSLPFVNIKNEKYSDYWIAEDNRIFEMNKFGSFKQINHKFERFQDAGNAFTRHHSGFGGIMAYGTERAKNLFDSSKVISELPDSYSILVESNERMSQTTKKLMEEQAQIGQKYLEETYIQARW